MNIQQETNESFDMSDNDMRELSINECDQVGGGLVGISAALYMIKVAIVAAKLGISIGQAIALLGKNTTITVSNNNTGFGSDRRIKQDVKEEGRIAHLDLTVYSWEYINAPGERFVGVMAQDLLAREELAHSVFTFEEGPFKGFYGVDYAALGLRCITAEAFDGDVATLITHKDALLAA
jgi:hypothetical protein